MTICVQMDEDQTYINMECTDGRSVKVLLPPVRFCFLWLCCHLRRFDTFAQVDDVTAIYVEIVGTVVDTTTIKLLQCINFGSRLGRRLLTVPLVAN